jgi:HD-GYP domain-containing protein (c-di-GMP phosphodiesterase class II)
LTWRYPPGEPSNELRKLGAMAKASIYMLGGGGVLGLASVALPGNPGRDEYLITLVSLGAIALALLCVAVIDMIPRWFLELTPTFATALITANLFLSGERNGAAPVFYFVVILYSFSFFPTRTAILQVALIAVSEAAVATQQPATLSPDAALITFGVLTGSAYVLQRSSRRLHALVDSLLVSRQELRRSREQTIERLSLAAEFRDLKTAEHTLRMGRYCGLLAARLALPPERCELIRWASELHDVGKIGIPDNVLRKPGLLDPHELAVMRTHAELGHKLLAGSGEEVLELAALIALTHHERWDGSGYPRGLVGNEIPLEGRIAAIADVFDALLDDRTYRPPLGVEEALGILREGRGSHFDPVLLDLFFQVLPEVLAVAGLRRSRPAEGVPMSFSQPMPTFEVARIAAAGAQSSATGS